MKDEYRSVIFSLLLNKYKFSTSQLGSHGYVLLNW